MDTGTPATAAGNAKQPRTDRGRRTLRKLLDAAAAEFGEKGFHEASISAITARAGTALGSFYTYFDSKDAIFRALVRDMSEAVKVAARDALIESAGEPVSALERERAALAAFLRFAAEHKEVYRIIDEAEFVDPESYRQHYETTGARILERLHEGGRKGELRPDEFIPVAEEAGLIGALEKWVVRTAGGEHRRGRPRSARKGHRRGSLNHCAAVAEAMRGPSRKRRSATATDCNHRRRPSRNRTSGTLYPHYHLIIRKRLVTGRHVVLPLCETGAP